MLSAAQLRAELRRLQEIVAVRLGDSDLRARIEETLVEMERRSGGWIENAGPPGSLTRGGGFAQEISPEPGLNS